MTTTRTCVGCQEAEAAAGLVRLVLGPEGELLVDVRSGSLGRGAWIHARPACVVKGVPRGVARVLKASVRATPEDVAEGLRVAGMRRLLGLLSAGRGAKRVAVGVSAVEEAAERGFVRLVIVAHDAKAAATSRVAITALEEGYGVHFSTKAELGAALGRDEAGIVAVLDTGLAASVREALELASFGPLSARSAGRRVLAAEAS